MCIRDRVPAIAFLLAFCPLSLNDLQMGIQSSMSFSTRSSFISFNSLCELVQRCSGLVVEDLEVGFDDIAVGVLLCLLLRLFLFHRRCGSLVELG